MNLAECYRLLGLNPGASFDDIKSSYRRLARRYHPDVNPGDGRAKERFIEITAAYKFLLAQPVRPLPQPKQQTARADARTDAQTEKRKQAASSTPSSAQPSPRSTPPPRRPPAVQFNPDLSPIEQQLKASSYEQLQKLLRHQRFPRAIALVEGLAERLPQDPEVTQWQAIVYQRWGRYLIQERQLEKARIYLKKALRTDPHNRSLWSEIEKDFRCMERIF
jgi:curved DNA-binding protein CbpA